MKRNVSSAKAAISQLNRLGRNYNMKPGFQVWGFMLGSGAPAPVPHIALDASEASKGLSAI